MRNRTTILITAATVVVVAGSTTWALAADTAGTVSVSGRCAGRGTAVVIDTRAHRMHMCAAGRVERTYPVAIGGGGVGKRRQGDRKTPLGRYALGKPRRSRSFITFIPVGYPTVKQRQTGFTGSAIGIHGPIEHLAAAGRLNTMTDWTDGCIAVGSAAEIADVAAFVRKHHVRIVHLEPDAG